MNFDQKKQFELRQVLEENTSDIKSAAANLGKWIERKKSEAEGIQADGSEDIPKIRNMKYLEQKTLDNNVKASSTGNNVSDNKRTDSTNMSIDTTTNPKIHEANQYKQKGNRCIKLEQFDAAIAHYTLAIEQYNADPIFYCNRAFCYLKLENYTKCIEDCENALKINPKYVKAYYRKMQAHENLGNNEAALINCLKILELDSNNNEALLSRNRLENRLNRDKGKSINLKNISKASNGDTSWSKLNGRGKECHFIEKAPESRSKKPLKSVEIKEIDGKTNETESNIDVQQTKYQPIEQLAPENQNKNMVDVISNAMNYKELGNDCVKRGKHDDAILYYTQAIETYASNSTFYCNRALCHLKLNRYVQCISDCDKAIKLDGTLVKAYYRRMQALELMGNYSEALVDCKNVLRLDPNNKESQQALKRLIFNNPDQDVRKEKNQLKQIPGSRGKDIYFIKKSPHQRSNKSLQRISINEISTSDIPLKRKNGLNNSEMVAETLSEPPVNKPKSSHENDIKSRLIFSLSTDVTDPSIIPQPPPTSAAFHSVWKQLTDPYKRYLYLKKIDVNRISQILGALFDSKTLSDILHILSVYYIRDNCPVHDILKEIAKNDEFKILKMMLSDEEDKTALNELFRYMRSYYNNTEDIELIIREYTFN